MDCKQCPKRGDENCVASHDIQRKSIVVVYEVSKDYVSWKVEKFCRDRTNIFKIIQEVEIWISIYYKEVKLVQNKTVWHVAKLVWTAGYHLCQPLEIDFKPWRSLESPDMWLKLMVSYFSLMSTRVVDVNKCDGCIWRSLQGAPEVWLWNLELVEEYRH